MTARVKLALTVGSLCLVVLAAIAGVLGALWADLGIEERAASVSCWRAMR
jgi:hypothetical protein